MAPQRRALRQAVRDQPPIHIARKPVRRRPVQQRARAGLADKVPVAPGRVVVHGKGGHHGVDCVRGRVRSRVRGRGGVNARVEPVIGKTHRIARRQDNPRGQVDQRDHVILDYQRMGQVSVDHRLPRRCMAEEAAERAPRRLRITGQTLHGRAGQPRALDARQAMQGRLAGGELPPQLVPALGVAVEVEGEDGVWLAAVGNGEVTIASRLRKFCRRDGVVRHQRLRGRERIDRAGPIAPLPGNVADQGMEQRIMWPVGEQGSAASVQRVEV